MRDLTEAAMPILVASSGNDMDDNGGTRNKGSKDGTDGKESKDMSSIKIVGVPHQAAASNSVYQIYLMYYCSSLCRPEASFVSSTTALDVVEINMNCSCLCC